MEPSARTYWVQVFSVKTWSEFLKAGGRVTGFLGTRWHTVQRITVGDYLLCYLSRVSRWVAVLEVASEPYVETNRIWEDDLFPCRVDVQILAALTPEIGIPIKSMRDSLSIFRSRNWSFYLMSPPSRWSNEDGAAVVNAIKARHEELKAP